MSWVNTFLARMHMGVDMSATQVVSEDGLDSKPSPDGQDGIGSVDGFQPSKSTRIRPFDSLHASLTHSHPVYADGCLILVGDKVRSHNKIDGEYYEGSIAGVTSTSLFCIPMIDVTLSEGVCDHLYLLERAPRTEARALSKLEQAKLKLLRGDPLDTDERALLFEATERARRNGH